MGPASRSDATYRAVPGVIARRIDSELVLVDLSTDQIYALSHTAGRLWELLGNGHSIEAATAVLRDEFPEERAADVTAEVERTVADMVERGLLRPA